MLKSSSPIRSIQRPLSLDIDWPARRRVSTYKNTSVSKSTSWVESVSSTQPKLQCLLKSLEREYKPFFVVLINYFTILYKPFFVVLINILLFCGVAAGDDRNTQASSAADIL